MKFRQGRTIVPLELDEPPKQKRSETENDRFQKIEFDHHPTFRFVF